MMSVSTPVEKNGTIVGVELQQGEDRGMAGVGRVQKQDRRDLTEMDARHSQH
jgi:hypothetical protein